MTTIRSTLGSNQASLQEFDIADRTGRLEGESFRSERRYVG